MKHTPLLLSMAAFAGAAAAFAHGDDHHAAPARKYDAARVEATPFGQEGDPKRVTRTVRVTMSDAMRFDPAQVTVRRGDTVRFVVDNKGAMLHEMVLGTADDLARHAEMMRKFPGMEHDDANIAHVKPGATGEMVWQFTQPGEFRFACLVPGHYEAGMVGKVVVK
jgi:uncharacterized cupredoxin-like copper-binding protein